MAEPGRSEAAGWGEARLAVEFGALYLGVPLLLALAAPADWLWPALFGMTAVALALLAITPGFAWGELARGWRRVLSEGMRRPDAAPELLDLAMRAVRPNLRLAA